MGIVLREFSFREVGSRRYVTTVTGSELKKVAEVIMGEEAYLSSISAIDVPSERKIELNYIFWSIKHKVAFVVKVSVSRENPVVPSVSDIVPGATKSEMEVHDLMGVIFEGNKNLRRGFLASEDVVTRGVYPLRKDSGV